MRLVTSLAGSGPPILCLHGHPGSGACMEVFTRPLSQKYFTLAPDLRGYGRSQTKTEFAIATHLDDLEALLDRYGIKKCLILGWSLGGIIGLELALRSPERISGLILVASSARPWSDHPPITWQDNLYTGIASLLNWVWPGWQWNIDTFGQRSLYRYLIQQHDPQVYHYLATYALPAYVQTSAAAQRSLATALKNRYNRLADLPQLECPCLVLAGKDDRHITASSSQETAEQLPNSEWRCYPQTAHLFPWEIPDQVLRDIETWLQEHPQVVDRK